MSSDMSSRERMLAALECREVDHVPCCFMIYAALSEKCKDTAEFVERQLELGLDTKVNLPRLPYRFHPAVETKVWKTQPSDREFPLLHKEYRTPEGPLTAVVNLTEDWPHGDSVPLFDDFLIPRSEQFLISAEEDLKRLKFLLHPLTADDIREFREAAAGDKALAEKHGLLVAGGRAMGVDTVMWLCGMVNAVLFAVDKPEFMQKLVGMIGEWNLARMEVILDAGVDLIIKRAWYEGTDFWSPALYRQLMVPVIKKDVELTHQAGAKFAYILTSGMMPLMGDIIEAGVDVIIGIDPVQGKGTDLALAKEAARGKICLWGGVNGFVTVETGTAEEVEEAVRSALAALGPDGFILSPVDNIRDGSPGVQENVARLIESWKKLR